jgi:hypothetical protein
MTITPENSNAPQPPPIAGEGDMWAEILAILPADDPLRPHAAARRQMGIDKYGVPLQANNGRKAVVDLFEEQLDSIVYAQQWSIEVMGIDSDALALALHMRWDAINNARKLLRYL